jgi:signal transduction histidine kinase/DNA-binding response OmpR family regulator
MALPVTNLKTRTALSIASVIVAILVANAFYLILTKRRELRKDIENRATLFASLTTKPICVGYDNYHDSGFYKFQELVSYYLTLEPDVERVVIMHVNGKILFDSADADDIGRHPSDPDADRRVEGAERLEAIKRLEAVPLRGRNASGEETLEIIAPYIEDWGRHSLSVAYHVSYKKLGPAIRRLIYATGGLTLVSILASVLVAVALASRITSPLEELTAGAKSIAEGNFDRPLGIKSGDELQILAETFTYMTERLKHNVEQLEESNKKLAAANEELKELDRLKSDLLANVSHELRTPLTAIKGYTDYILDGKLGPVTEKQERGLVVVQRNLERLSKSINALLDFSRMEMGRITLNIQPFNLSQLADSILTTLRSELEKKKITFTSQVPLDLPPVIADREKLSQVIENLVINALKFTPEGGRITLAASRDDLMGRPAAEIRISDTGIGIPAGQVGKIFNRFHQVDGSTTRRFGGVGLGLAIVKSILDAHAAPVVVESEVGRGTSFRFTLPLLEKGAEAPGREDRAGTRVDEGLVLVVDDDLELMRMTKSRLEQEGFAVLTATTGEEGMRLAARRRPDVILLALLLPDRSGLEVLHTLKSEPATRDIPVLVVSIDSDGVRALSLGASEWLRKPCDAASIVAVVQRLMAGSSADAPTVLVVDDEPDTVQFLRDTLKAEGFRVITAHDGRQALDTLKRVRPDLVLLDIMMPELSGFQVLEALGSDPRTAPIPVVVLTARADDVDAQRGLALGARRYMSKPFDVGALIAEIQRQVGGRAASSRNGQAAL